MHYSSRRRFLQTSATLLATAIAGSSFNPKKKELLLSFSTLGCPDWTFQQIADFAARYEYNGIEVRGVQRQLDLTKCKEFSTAENRAETMKIMKDKKLRFVDLGSSATLHFAAGAERQKNLEEGKRFIDLAQQLGLPIYQGVSK